MTDGETVTVELSKAQFDRVHELALRGLMAKGGGDRGSLMTPREYGVAYDAFVDSAGVPRRIGDQPANVREVWDEFFEECAHL